MLKPESTSPKNPCIMDSYIRQISDIIKEDAPMVGAKAANLGEMYRLGLHIPPAFALSTQCFSDFLNVNHLSEQLRLLLSQTNPQNPERLSDIHRLIEHLFISAPLPAPLESPLHLAVKSLSAPLFAVRSSAVGEDSLVSSFAGQNETFLGVQGQTNITLAIKKCWASAFSPRSLSYRRSFGLDPEKIQIGVIIQALISPDISGVVFSINPVTGDQETVVIEAVFGLGELLVSGQVTPDHYELSKTTRVITLEQLAVQEKKLTVVGGQV
ncbi:PEP/pyruvate-binding domain-containing protein, partial [Candidatus Microgenomates bacterium]|nr:PEP/pyruvate-binding domain-containing protein [Candidatus Microgenomates bacterium]